MKTKHMGSARCVFFDRAEPSRTSTSLRISIEGLVDLPNLSGWVRTSSTDGPLHLRICFDCAFSLLCLPPPRERVGRSASFYQTLADTAAQNMEPTTPCSERPVSSVGQLWLPSSDPQPFSKPVRSVSPRQHGDEAMVASTICYVLLAWPHWRELSCK